MPRRDTRATWIPSGPGFDAPTTQARIKARLEHIAAVEPYVNALVHLDTFGALSTARRQDANAAPAGPLAGLPVVVKDNIAVAGAPWAAGSVSRRGVPGPRADAPSVERLRTAGAIVLGTTNLDEFAMGASTESSCFGPSSNPWDLTRTPGGSSGGSAAAIASHEVAAALGTDTGGSIREPAAQCGIVGVRPTSGRVPLGGVVPFAPSLDVVGPMARTVAGAAEVHDVIAGNHPHSRRSMTAAAARGARRTDLRGIRIAVLIEMSGSRNSPGVLGRYIKAVELIDGLGAELVEESAPLLADGLQAYYDITTVESLEVLETHIAAAPIGEEAMNRLARGRTLVGTAALTAATATRDAMRQRLDQVFASCDLAITPTMPMVAPRLGRFGIDDPLATPSTDCWTVAANLADVPAISLPCGLGHDSGMPVGLQLMASRGRDDRAYEIAAMLEAAGVGE